VKTSYSLQLQHSLYTA